MRRGAGPRSRLMAALEGQIRAASNPLDMQCLRAERAALLARQGQIELARRAIEELRAQLAWHPNHTRLQAWLALAEGLLAYYSVSGLAGRDRVEEAYAVARTLAGAEHARLRATTAAWMATMDYARDAFAPMAAHIREALDEAAAEHHGARARATLVAAHSWHFAGRDEVAHGWYEASRRHAVVEGDEAHLSALMHNQAWLRAAHVRMDLLFDACDDKRALSQALMSAESIGHYDAGIGTASLGSLVPILRAQVLAALGRWAEAMALFDMHYDTALSEGLRRIAPSLLADRAWCDWHEGRAERARVHLAAAERALEGPEPIDTDDRATALARLAQVHEALGSSTTAVRLRDDSRRLLAQHREQQRQIAALLDQALAGVRPDAA